MSSPCGFDRESGPRAVFRRTEMAKTSSASKRSSRSLDGFRSPAARCEPSTTSSSADALSLSCDSRHADDPRSAITSWRSNLARSPGRNTKFQALAFAVPRSSGDLLRGTRGARQTRPHRAGTVRHSRRHRLWNISGFLELGVWQDRVSTMTRRVRYAPGSTYLPPPERRSVEPLACQHDTLPQREAAGVCPLRRHGA